MPPSWLCCQFYEEVLSTVNRMRRGPPDLSESFPAVPSDQVEENDLGKRKLCTTQLSCLRSWASLLSVRVSRRERRFWYGVVSETILRRLADASHFGGKKHLVRTLAEFRFLTAFALRLKRAEPLRQRVGNCAQNNLGATCHDTIL